MLKGRVSDQDGYPLSDVIVEIADTSIKTKTLSNGNFILGDLPLSKVLLLFSHPDYISQSLEVIILDKKEKWIEISLTAKNPMLMTVKEEITVTAEADSIIDISLPSHRTILPSSVLVEMGTANVAEAVDKIPGVAAVGKGGYSMVPAIRGLAEHRILLMLDGIRITSERRIGASASFINLHDIDRIEVNRGPYSVFHGSGAVGGIINIITKSPSSHTPFGGKLYFSYNTARKERAVSANIRGSWNKFGFLLGVNGKKAGEYSAPSGKIGMSQYSDYDLLFKVNREWKNSQFYLSLFHYKGDDIGKPSPASQFKPRWYPEEKNTLFSVGYKVREKFNLDVLDVNLSLFHSTLDTQKENLSESLTLKKKNLANVEGTNFGIKVRGGKTLSQTHELNFGLDFFGRGGVNDSNSEWQYDENGDLIKRTEGTSLHDARSSNFGFYIDDKIRFSSDVRLNLGIRYDFIRTSNFFPMENRRSRNDQTFSAYLGTVWQINSYLSLLANAGRSFRFPALSELFYSGLTGRGTVFGNPDLDPEKSLNLDLGLRYLHAKFFMAIYGFSNTIQDMVQKYSGPGEEEFFYRNLSSGRVIGVEGELYFLLMKDLELFFNFHHMRGRERETEEALNYIPPTRAILWTKYSPGKFWIEPKIAFSAAKSNPGPLEKEIDGYILIDMIIGYKISEKILLLFVGQNLLNQTYRASADELGVDAPGRGVVLKMSYSF
jgi:iron complex outermembrane receptor protein